MFSTNSDHYMNFKFKMMTSQNSHFILAAEKSGETWVCFSVAKTFPTANVRYVNILYFILKSHSPVLIVLNLFLLYISKEISVMEKEFWKNSFL